MKLSYLLSAIGITLPMCKNDIEILTLTESSANADKGSLFVCIAGTRADGHAFAEKAYQQGCRAFVTEKAIALPPDATVIQVSNTRCAIALLASRFYDAPSHKMTLIGITGTKGKTTTALMIKHILEKNGTSCGYIGTNGIFYGDQEIPTTNTTPDAVTLQKTLANMLANGIKAAVIEVSSQALKQYRAHGTRFHTVVFTNLAPDHIGTLEHESFEDYKACKKRLFTEFSFEHAVVFSNDPAAVEMLEGTTAANITRCSLSNPDAEFFGYEFTPIKEKHLLGFSFKVSTFIGEQNFQKVPLVGEFNAANLLLATAVTAVDFGISLQNTAKSIKSLQISGRSSLISICGGAHAVIDYAHNGMSLSALLSTLREYTEGRLVCLFGSVGGRTKSRRYEMGEAAARLSDIAVLTSDNPGDEDPIAILSEIASAFEGSTTPYLIIPDRKEAIEKAVTLLADGDILVLAGKGQENYQWIGKEKIPFSEREILQKYAMEAGDLLPL